MTGREQPLKVELKAGLLTISIGAAALITALKGGPAFGGADEPEIYDEDAFLRAFVEELENEEEDGSNRIHRMFDAVAEEAINQGAEGINIKDGD